MKDQHGNKITEHEFTKDIGHRTEMTKTIEELFEEYAGCYRAVDECLKELTCPMCKEDKERMKEIIQEVTKQIQSDILKEVMKLQQELNVDGNYFDVISPDNIKKLAEEKGILIN